ncbi:MAG: inositol monophosphatase family protein [Myxococcota bacterium]
MDTKELEEAARVAARAADAARAEIMPRFRHVDVETKSDGSPVTEADRRAEQAIRRVLHEAYPDFGLLGEEYGAEEPKAGQPTWVIDPIDGTIAFSRGIPLFSTLIALQVDGRSVMGLIDLPALGERTVGWQGGGCRRNGELVRASSATDLERAIVSHGDPYCFRQAGREQGLLEMNRRIRCLRGYTDAFGHALVISGAVDAMVDLDLNPWDVAPIEVLAEEAGGACRTLPQEGDKVGVVFGSPSLVEQLTKLLDG